MVSPKEDIRQRLKARRDALPASERSLKSARIASETLEILPEGVRRVGVYAAIGSEVDLEVMTEVLRARGVEVLYPRCPAVGRLLEFVPVGDPATLEGGRFGIPEPEGEATDLAAIDVLLVPGVGYDRRGSRIGYGGGYYDATLAQFHGLAIGVAFAEQIVERLPGEDHDRSVQMVVTDEGPVTPSAPTEEEAHV